MTSKILVFTLWLNFPWGCLLVCVIPFVFFIPTAVVTHTFSANTEQKAAPFAVSVWSNCFGKTAEDTESAWGAQGNPEITLLGLLLSDLYKP